uniref:Uncharacterized protein n=1 Tax=Siphoviridae sp. ct8Ri8 TaxID=2826170 RepID=A0A8S5MT61_9CAUD|nr:MAG TPA: hypothetical protein [Siphoviridae sp. ct8Ri8]
MKFFRRIGKHCIIIIVFESMSHSPKTTNKITR